MGVDGDAGDVEAVVVERVRAVDDGIQGEIVPRGRGAGGGIVDGAQNVAGQVASRWWQSRTCRDR